MTAQPGRMRLPSLFARANLPLLALAALFVLLLVVSILGSRPPEPLPFDLDSTAPTGLRALDLWLQELGYNVQRLSGLQFSLPPAADLLFVYPNQLSYSATEAAALRAWVAEGRTLVIVGPHPEDAELARVFGVRSSPRAGFRIVERQAQPLIPEGDAEYITDWNMGTDVLDLAAAPAAVPVLRTEDGDVTAAVQNVGEGVVWHLTPGVAFVNRALAEENHGQLLPPLLRGVPPGGVVAFDTYHQFGISRVGEQIATLQDWLYRTPWGWATLSAFLATALYLLLAGRRLGPAIPTRAERRRREAAEYVVAMAALSRRSGLREDVARYQTQRLKRGLARRCALDGDLPDREFLERLALAEPRLEAAAQARVAQALTALHGKPNEQQLVALAAEVDALLAL